MDSEISETTNRPVVVAPTFSTFHARKEDPRYPGIIYGYPDDRMPPDDGVREILKVISALESAGIPCCITGTSALIYFGAARGRGDWQVCIPTEKLEAASLLLQSAPYTDHYTLSQAPPGIAIESLLHTFPRFKHNGFMLWFRIVPSEDCHIDCKPSNLERSKLGLPYPKLEVYAQSLLDTFNGVDLCDLVDGMNLSKEWGDEHLDLAGTNDVEWAKKKNGRIRKNVPDDDNACLFELCEGEISRRQFWEETTGGQRASTWAQVSKGVLRNEVSSSRRWRFEIFQI